MDIRQLRLDGELAFGELRFLGLKREKFVFDREKGRTSDVLEARIYNLASEFTQGQIEITIPEYVDLREIDFMKQVRVKNPIISARAQANGNFANVIWKIDAEDIVEVGVGAGVTDKKEPVENKK